MVIYLLKQIAYNDGDVENLKLKDEKWELVQDDSSSSEVRDCTLKNTHYSL